MIDNIQESENTEQPLAQDAAAPVETDNLEAQQQDASSEAPAAADEPQKDKVLTPSGYDVDDPRFEWFAIQTQSSMEKKAIQALRQRVEKYKLQELFGDIFVPTHTVEKVDEKGRKRKIERKVMPGYVLVQMEMNNKTYNVVKDTPRISTFIGGLPNKTPPPVSIPEVERMLNPQKVTENSKGKAVVSDDTKSTEAIDCPYAKGDKVTVTDGPFASFQGEVDEVKPEKKKLKLLISVFGRQTPVEIEFSKVEKVVD